MNILITGAAGFVGKNLTAALECIRDGRDKTHPGLAVGELYLYDIDSDPALLETACQKGGLRVQPCRRQPPEESGRVHAGKFRLCFHAAGHAEKIP